VRKLIGFFAGLAILALIVASVRVGIHIYNYAGASEINSVLIQTENLQRNRIEALPLEKMSEDYIRTRLIAKFAKIYLEVLPLTEELDDRAAATGALRLMSAPSVVTKWKNEVMPVLEKMAGEKKFREIIIRTRDIAQLDDYFVVPILMKTWDAANNPNASPIISNGGELYLKLRFNKKIRDMLQGRDFNAGAFLDKGLPPEAIFEFMVDEAVLK
jgi:hypothetical protein